MSRVSFTSPSNTASTIKGKDASAGEFIKMYIVFYSVIMDYLWQMIEINCCFAGAQYKQNIWALREKLQYDFIGCYLVSMTNFKFTDRII